MSNVVIINRSIYPIQNVKNIEQNKVTGLLFNVTKGQADKLKGLLENAKMTFVSEPDKINISTLEFNGIKVKPYREFSSSRMTLSKTYVVTMKQNFITRVNEFYSRVVGVIRPVFSIEHETNLQEALKEATTEIDLSALNASMAVDKPMPETTTQEQPNQVLANDPLGEKIIENPISINNDVQQPSELQTPVQTAVVNQPTTEQQVSPQVQTQDVNVAQNDTVNQELAPKQKRLLRRKGNVLAIPIVIIWLALVLFGTIKLVTNILT